MINRFHLWNGNKALTIAVLVMILFFAWKFYEAKGEAEEKMANRLAAVRAERASQIDSVWNNQEVIIAKMDSLMDYVRGDK